MGLGLTKSLGVTAYTGQGVKDYIYFQRSQATVSGPLAYISLVGSIATNVRAAIYSDSSGVPGTLLSESASVPQTDSNLLFIPIPIITIVAGTYYWIAAQTQANNGFWVHTNLTGYAQAQAYGAFPATASASPNPDANVGEAWVIPIPNYLIHLRDRLRTKGISLGA